MKMAYRTLFFTAIFQPKKHAALRLLPIGKVISYLMLLTLFMSFTSFYTFQTNMQSPNVQLDSMQQQFNTMKWLFYPLTFIFLFLMNTAVVFVQSSLYAFAALVMLKIFHRRGEYRMVWRTASFSMTLSIIGVAIFSLFLQNKTIVILIGIFLTLIYLCIAVQKYPKQPTK